MTTVWVNGTVSDAADAHVGALDHGLTVGDGVFETLKVIDGTPFALSRHLLRLRRSAEVLDLDLPLDDSAFETAVAEVLEAAGRGDGRLRITVTGGPGPLGSGRGDEGPTVLLAVTGATDWPATSDVVTVPWARNEHSAVAGAKTTSYAENVVALAHAHRLGADEAVFANTVGALCEGTGSNVFLVTEGRLSTPALSTGCLAGITRDLVLELVEVDESAELTLDHLREAEEAFLTSSTRDVHPIARVDGGTLLNAAPGPVTREVAAAFAALQARTLDP